MIRAVLDTNVIISALTHKKFTPPSVILSLIEEKKLLHVTSPEILDEVEEVMNREKVVKMHNLQPREIRNLILNLAEISEIVHAKNETSIVKADPDDDKFIAAAIGGSASFIISGDRHLLEIGGYQGIKIMKVRNFLENVIQKT